MGSKLPKRDGGRPSLLTVRSTLILLLAILAGGLVAVLMLAAGHHAAEAALGGLGAFGATAAAGNEVIG